MNIFEQLILSGIPVVDVESEALNLFANEKSSLFSTMNSQGANAKINEISDTAEEQIEVNDGLKDSIIDLKQSIDANTLKLNTFVDSIPKVAENTTILDKINQNFTTVLERSVNTNTNFVELPAIQAAKKNETEVPAPYSKEDNENFDLLIESTNNIFSKVLDYEKEIEANYDASYFEKAGDMFIKSLSNNSNTQNLAQNNTTATSTINNQNIATVKNEESGGFLSNVFSTIGDAVSTITSGDLINTVNSVVGDVVTKVQDVISNPLSIISGSSDVSSIVNTTIGGNSGGLLETLTRGNISDGIIKGLPTLGGMQIATPPILNTIGGNSLFNTMTSIDKSSVTNGFMSEDNSSIMEKMSNVLTMGPSIANSSIFNRVNNNTPSLLNLVQGGFSGQQGLIQADRELSTVNNQMTIKQLETNDRLVKAIETNNIEKQNTNVKTIETSTSVRSINNNEKSSISEQPSVFAPSIQGGSLAAASGPLDLSEESLVKLSSLFEGAITRVMMDR